MTMTNQITHKQSIQEQVFNEGTIYRASMMYKKYINFRLDELQQAMNSGKHAEADVLKGELNLLRQNLAELGDVEELTASMNEVATLTAPVKTTEIQSRIAVLTPKNVSKALSVYHGYVDVYLDVLFSAIKSGDTKQADEVKMELESLRQNIVQLEVVQSV